jgi:urease accessory protein
MLVGEPALTATEPTGQASSVPTRRTLTGGSGRSPLLTVLRALQFGDSMFPVGAFSFSHGLETAVAQGVVRDRESLRAYVETVVHQAAIGDGVALVAAHRAAVHGDLDRIRRADEEVQLRKLNEETRMMTVRMGRKLAEAGVRIVGDSLLARRLAEADRDPVPVTYPVALGVLGATVGIPEAETFATHQYGTAVTVLGAAVRLMRVDHLDTQEILFRINDLAEAAYARVRDTELTEMAGFAPLMDVLAATHVRAHVRLFMN